MTDVPVSQDAGKTYPRMTWAASHKHTCNLCHMDKNPADGCNCGAELIDLIRSEMMSDEHPISEWEVRFAEKIKALPMFARHRHQAERDTLARMEPVAWMPIRTAPRNETMIVLGGEGQQTWVGFFSGWNNYWTTGEVDRSRDHVMHTPQPTHWMPLPPAPEAGQ